MNSQKLTVVILAGLMIATGALAGGIATPTDSEDKVAMRQKAIVL